MRSAVNPLIRLSLHGNARILEPFLRSIRVCVIDSTPLKATGLDSRRPEAISRMMELCLRQWETLRMVAPSLTKPK